MRLEGTLDAFSLPDILQLLSATAKTGALHLKRPAGSDGAARRGVVHLRNGRVTGARGDAVRQELGRRLLGSGAVDDEALAQAAETLADSPGAGLAQLLVARSGLDPEVARRIAAEQIADAVFELLRWPDGEFSFTADDDPSDDLGAEVPVEHLVAEGRERLAAWPAVADRVPAADAVLRVNPAPPASPAVSAEEWSLLALVDGRRTVGELVALAGRGEYAVVTVLAALVGRGLLVVGETGDDRLLRRHRLLSALEGMPPSEPLPVPAPPQPEPVTVAPASVSVAPADVPAQPEPDAVPLAAVSAAPADVPPGARPGIPAAEPGAPADGTPGPQASASPDLQPDPPPAPPRHLAPEPAPSVIPQRQEPFTPPRKPAHAEEFAAPAGNGGAVASVIPIGGHGGAEGASVRQPGAARTPVERDPGIDKTLLLRLIAGVRGL